MLAVRKALAGLCAVAFVLTAVTSLLLFNIERHALNANTYKQALAEQGIYEQAPALIGEMMVAASAYDPCETNLIACGADERSPEAVACFEAALGSDTYQALITGGRKPTDAQAEQASACLNQFPPTPVQNEGGPPPFLKNLSATDWQHVIQTLLPPAELKGLVDQALDSTFAVLNGEADSASLDITGFKSRLTGPAGVEAVMSLLKAQPPCTLEQAAEMTLSALDGSGDLELCNPSDELAFIVQPLVESNLQLAAFAIPDQVTFIPRAVNLAGDETPLERLLKIRLGLRLTLLIPLVFLLGITALVVRTPKSWLSWWGWPFLITGIPCALIGFLSAPVFNLALTTILTRRLPAYLPVGIVELGSEITAAVVRQMLRPLAWESVALIILSSLMIFLASRLERKAPNAPVSKVMTEIPDDEPSSDT